MATIRTAIELEDRLSGVLNGVLNSVNVTVSAIEKMNGNLNRPIESTYFEEIRNSIARTSVELGNLNEDMERMAGTAARVPAVPHMQPAAAPWQSYEGIQVFTDTGMDRFQQEIAGVNAMMERLADTQNRLTRQANESEILSPQASYDVQSVENRVSELIDLVNKAESNPLNIGTEEANTQFERLRMRLDQTLQLQDNLNAAMQGMDIGEINAAYLRLSQNVSDTERMVRDSFANIPSVEIPPVEVPINWNSDSLEVFTSSGIERFKQEIQSAEAMLRGISESQLNIAANSEQTSVFPAAMTKDMQNMQARITAVQNKVREIGAKPINLVTAADSAMLEQLRGQLAGITNEQESLNAAVEAMDVSEANQAYLRLSRTVGNTERYIRDNAAEQERFNRKIESGIGGSDRLTQSIKGMAAAYISVQSLGKVLGLSDELTQITARLNMMNDGLQSTENLQNMIFRSAQRSRGSYQATADAVAKLGLMAGDAFGSSAEVIAFMEQINKQFTIAGTSATGIDAAMLQLTQAMGSGVLRGEEFNSIFEQAPTIMQAIADYMDVPIGKLKDMAAEGEITAGIVKAAMFDAAEKTNEKFENMPMTFEQVWTSFKNKALMAFQPVLQKLNEIANSDKFQRFTDKAADALSKIADSALNVLDNLVDVANFVSDNWSDIAPLIEDVAGAMLLWKVATGLATVAQNIYNASLQGCPIVWIIDMVVLAIFLGIAFDRMINSVMGNIVGAVYVAGAFFKDIGLSLANFVLAIWHYLTACFDNILAGFNNVWVWLQKGFWSFIEGFLKGVAVIAEKINSLIGVFGLEINTSRILAQIDNIAAKKQELENQTKAFKDPTEAWNEGLNTFKVFEEGWADKAYKEGEIYGNAMSEAHDKMYDNVKNGIWNWLLGIDEESVGGAAGAGKGLENFLGNNEFDDLYKGVYNVDDNTGDMADSLSMTDEELKYLRDIAERETINRFTTAEINFDMSGMQNTVNNDNDIDGIITRLTDEVTEAVFIVTEGVHG